VQSGVVWVAVLIGDLDGAGSIKIPLTRSIRFTPRNQTTDCLFAGLDWRFWVLIWFCENRFFIGEFDPGSERTLAARFIHASRAIKTPFGGCIKRRTGE
jgi:hypothetical protein